MDINLTGTVATNTTLLQPGYNGYMIAAAGVIVGAAVTGGLTLIRDTINRKRDREDKKNRLIGQLVGHKSLILQYYAFYFYSFISHEYLLCRATIQGINGINYDQLASIPISERNKEIMKMANASREESVEYERYRENLEELNRWKWELTKSNSQLWIIIGSLRNYYPHDSIFTELSKQIEAAEDYYSRFEIVIKDKFNSLSNLALTEAGLIPAKAAENSVRPHDLQERLFYDLIKKTDAENQALRKERQDGRNDPLETKINTLITYLRG